MATYVMADIHGEYDRYLAMLELINFTDQDTLYLLGDLIDRGPDPVRLLKDVELRSNVFCLAGNHELMAIDLLESLLVEISEENASSHINEQLMQKWMEYQRNGGGITLRQFQLLSKEERFDLLDFLKEFVLVDAIDVGEKTFVLSHTGNIHPDKCLSEHSAEELAFARADYEKKVFKIPNVYVVGGHTPTLALIGKPRIFKKNNCINIDCGATFGGKLACLRLEDFEEFYV